MPIYGYHCGRCSHEFEVRQSMSDAPLKDCPECGGELRKLLYPVGVQFKGSGFYTTDYRSGGGDDSKTPAKGAEGKSESSTSPGPSNGSDTPSSSSTSSEKKAEPAASKE